METATLSYFEHACMDKECDGQIVSQTGGLRIVRRVALAIPGRKILKSFESEEAALDWAAKNNYQVK